MNRLTEYVDGVPCVKDHVSIFMLVKKLAEYEDKDETLRGKNNV